MVIIEDKGLPDLESECKGIIDEASKYHIPFGQMES
jgi:hypothetical protein